MKRAFAFAVALCIAPLSACGGSGSSGGSTLPSNPQQPSHAAATATITLSIPNAVSPSSTARRPTFIGAAVAGVSLQFFLHSDTGHTNPIGSGTFDVSASSGLCTPPTGVRTCSLQQTTLVGTEDLVVTTYDAAPVAGSFTGAHQLGIGTIYGVTLAAGSNTLAVAVGGTVATLAIAPATVSLPAGSPANFPLTYTAYDKAGEMIVAGMNTVMNGSGNSETDTYSNPITISVSELGGSGHTLLSTGGAPASSVVVSTSNATVHVLYDGGGSSGYSAAVAATSIGATSAYEALQIKFGAGIYAANVNGPTIETFPYISSLCTTSAPCTLNESPLATIATPPDPTAVALDSNSNIYVTNYYPSNEVTVYNSSANGSATPIETIAFGGNYPQFIAVDSLGRIYVDSANGAFVKAYAPVSPSCTTATPCVNPPAIATYQVLSPPPYAYPYGVAVDSSNRLYVYDKISGAFSVFAALSPTCTTTAPCNISYTQVVASLPFTGTAYGNPAIDASGRIYLTLTGGAQVFAPVPTSCSVSAPCTISQIASITGTLGELAIDPSGNIYSSTGSTNSITVYPPVSSACSIASPCSITASPIATISGASTGLMGQQGIAVH